MRIKLITLLAMPCFAATANVTSPSAPYTKLPDHRVVSGHAAFGFDLLRQLSVTPGKNVFISPSSIAAALEMTYNGAFGQTKAQMAKTLHLDGLSLEIVNQSNDALGRGLVGADPEVEVAATNSLWAQEAYSFLPDFIGRSKHYYGAEVANLNFGGPDAPASINGWVRSHTEGKIDNLVGVLDRDTALVLVNAIYFHGRWTTGFDSRSTLVDPFNLQDGTSKQAPMMRQSGEYLYLKGDTFEAVRLPYGADRFAMYVFLPNRRSGLPDLLDRIDSTQVAKWMAAMESAPGSIKLPRFRVEYGQSLNQALQTLGMIDSFNRRSADFTGMTGKRDLFISAVMHKAYVDVNEAGTEAAAATAVVGFPRGAPPKKPAPFVLRVDHPFLCAIRDDRTGEILFLGAIYNPS